MTKRLNYFTFILVVYSINCGQIPSTRSLSNGYVLDTSVIAILPLDVKKDWIFIDGKSTALTNDDLFRIETILSRCITDYNLEQEKRYKEINSKLPEYKFDKREFIIDISRFKSQFMARINSKGDKEVWANCFCHTWDSNLKNEFVIVDNGGNCYFNLKINLNTDRCYDFIVNGEA